jgi:hypothetical protein
MVTVLHLITLWIAASVPVALVFGQLIAFSNPNPETAEI